MNAVCETQQLYQFNDVGLRQKMPNPLTYRAGATSPAWIQGRLSARTIFLEGFDALYFDPLCSIFWVFLEKRPAQRAARLLKNSPLY